MGISLQAPPEGSPWRTVLRVALLFLVEAALIALIKDAPIAILIATVFCAFAALATLEGEAWLNKRHRLGFSIAIFVVSAVYLSLVAYGVVHATNEEIAKHKIKALYAEGAPFLDLAHEVEEFKSQPEDFKTARDRKADDLVAEVRNWTDKTSTWLRDNLGETAKQRFLDTSDLKSFCWTFDCLDPFSRQINLLVTHRRNLSAILENLSVYNSD